MMKEDLLTIGSVAKITGTSVKTVRYYHDIGLLVAAEVSPSGRRYYSIREIWHLQLILNLRHMGFGITEIRKIVAHGDALHTIELQIKLIESQINHQTNILRILQDALQSGSDAKALHYIQHIGQEIRMDTNRRQALLDRLESVLVEEDAPVDWKEQMLQPFLELIGADPTDEQLSAQNELFDLLSHGEISRELQGKIAPFWSMVHLQNPDSSAWNQSIQDIMTQVWNILSQGYGPKSKEMQDLASQFLDEIAKHVKIPPTPVFAQLFVEQLDNMTNGSFRRLWELVSVGSRIKPHIVLDAITQALRVQLETARQGADRDD